MKRLQVLSIGLLSLLLLTNCSSENATTSEPEEPAVASNLQVDINGVTHYLAVQGTALSNGGRFLAITGIEASTGDQIDIRLGSFNNDSAPLLSVQDYEISGNEMFVTYALDVANTFPNAEVLTLSEFYHGGSMSITSLDTSNTLISGTFSGTASNGVTDYTITNGRFTNLKYTFYE